MPPETWDPTSPISNTDAFVCGKGNYRDEVVSADITVHF